MQARDYRFCALLFADMGVGGARCGLWVISVVGHGKGQGMGTRLHGAVRAAPVPVLLFVWELELVLLIVLGRWIE